jgi:hypothetical protein
VSGPVVVVGAHRSGTTLVARLLQELGVDMGRRLSSNCEDFELVALHEWLLRRAGGSWEYPAPLLALLGNPELRQQARLILDDHRAKGRRRPVSWGWKDPRTAFTLELWTSVFPDLRAIVVRRHPAAASASLAARARREQRPDHSPLADRSVGPRLKAVLRKREHEQHFYRSVRCWEPDGALDVWAEYNGAIDRFIATAPDRVMAEVHLEDLLADPRAVVERFGQAGLGAPDMDPSQVVARLELRTPSERRSLWPSAEAMERTAAQAERYGYSHQTELSAPHGPQRRGADRTLVVGARPNANVTGGDGS